MRNLINNAIVYKAEMPGAAAMDAHLKELPTADIGLHESSRITIVPHGITEPPQGLEIIRPFAGGFAFTFRIQEKPIPPEVKADEIMARTEAKEDELGRILSKGEREELREQCVNDLLERAFVKTRMVTCYYWPDDRILIIPVTSKTTASRLVSQMIHATGSVRTTTIHVSDLKGGVTKRLKDCLQEEDEDAFKGFGIGDHLVIERKYEGEPKEREVYDRDSIRDSETGILRSLMDGFDVKQIGLVRNMTSFRLTDEFTLKGIDTDYEIDAESDAFTDNDWWAACAEIEVKSLVDVINALCTLVEYKEPDLSEDNDEGSDAT